jgi:hypothetical protein
MMACYINGEPWILKRGEWGGFGSRSPLLMVGYDIQAVNTDSTYPYHNENQILNNTAFSWHATAGAGSRQIHLMLRKTDQKGYFNCNEDLIGGLALQNNRPNCNYLAVVDSKGQNEDPNYFVTDANHTGFIKIEYSSKTNPERGGRFAFKAVSKDGTVIDVADGRFYFNFDKN